MDLMQVQVDEHRPIRYQAENWLISNEPWTFFERPAPLSLASIVQGAIVTKAPLLGCFRDRRALSDFPPDRHAPSLALVAPVKARWEARRTDRNPKQIRCQFDLGTSSYDLVVTDLEWIKRFNTLALGHYEPAAVGLKATDRPLLCISVGEPLNGSCYLLVAAVIVLNASWRKALYAT